MNYFAITLPCCTLIGWLAFIGHMKAAGGTLLAMMILALAYTAVLAQQAKHSPYEFTEHHDAEG